MKKLTWLSFALSSLSVFAIAASHAPSAKSAKPSQHSTGDILFRSPQNYPSIYSVRGDGTGLRKISRRPLGCIGLSWSPDKKSIVMAIATKVGVVQKRDVWRYNLAIMDARTGAVRNIKIVGHPNLKTLAPVFAPSGKEILFTGSVRQRFLDLYTVNLSGTKLKQLTKDGNASVGRFSPNGKQIAYCAFRNGSASVSTMNRNGGNIRQLTNNGIRNQTPVWSPNGRRIAFVSNRSGTFQIYAMNADGRAQKQLTRGANSHFSPTFSPDGRQIAFTRRTKNLHQIFLMSADGTRQRPLISRKDQYHYLDWR